MFDIRIEDAARVVMAGRLDAAVSDRAAEAFRQLQGPATVDCAGLDYISSAGISVIMEAYQRLTAAGQTLTLVNLAPRVRNVFVYAGLDKLLGIG